MTVCYHLATMLDHLVYAAPDLDQAIEDIERRLGIRPAPGGKHAGGLTHNALLSLGAGSYLELIAPVRDGELTAGLPFALETVTEPRLIAWAVSVDDIERRVEAAKQKGYDPGAVVRGGRDLPDGSSLNWRLTIKPKPAGDGLAPFLIQWLSDPHPSMTAPAGCQFVDLRAEHPDPAGIEAVFDALGVEMEAVNGPAPRLIATFDTPNGRVELS
jgi:hypothetical protein